MLGAVLRPEPQAEVLLLEVLLEVLLAVRPKERLAQRLPEALAWDPPPARVGYCPSICRLV